MRNSNLRKQMILMCSFFPMSVSAFASEADTAIPQAEKRIYKIDLSTQPVEDASLNEGNSSRIRVKDGVIYSIVDIMKVEPELRIELTDLPLLEGEGSEKLEFKVTTNYSDYITRYEISFYDSDDANALTPIQTVRGEKIKNEDTITVLDAEKLRGKNSQLKYKLKVFDKDGNFDETAVGYIEFRPFKSLKTLSPLEEAIKEKSRTTLLKKNIPARYGKVTIIGQNLKGVKEIEINQDKYTVDAAVDYFTAERLLPTDEQLLDVKIIFENGTNQQNTLIVAVPETYYSGVGVADFTIGRYESDIENPDEKSFYKKGRLAYYGKARFNKDVRGVFQFDTEEKEWDALFTDFFKKKKDDVYQRLREDDFYPTYGDDSLVIYENDVFQQGKIYAEIGYKKSRALWGTYLTDLSDTELSQVNRSLYGALVEVKSEKTTEFGDDQYKGKAYVAQAEVGHGRNEFLGTGGSLYFLQHGDIIKDSENVVVEVRNRETGLVEKRVSLFKGKDYRLDEYQGRIILTKALSQYGNDTVGGIIKNDLLDTFQQYLVVDYDYQFTTQERLENLTYGGRVQGWLNDSVSLGATHVHESQDVGGDFELTGVDGILRYSNSTYLKGEYSTSKNTQTQGNYLSSDGGLTFRDITGSFDDKSGSAYLISGNLNLHDLSPQSFSSYGNELSAWYKNKDAGFSMGGYDNSEEQRTYGTRLRLRPSDNLNLMASYSKNKITNYITDTTTERREILSQVEYMISSKFSVTGAVSDLVEEKSREKTQKATLLAGRVEYTQENYSLYGIVQTALRKENYDYSQIYTIGMTKEFPKQRIKISGEYSVTNQSDDSFKAKLEVRPTKDYTVYTGYDFSNVGTGNTNKVVFGNRYQYNSRIGIYTENQILREKDEKSNLQAYGMDYDWKEKHRLGISYQEGQVKTAYEEYNRRAISISSNYNSSEIRVANKLEYRKDSKSSDNAEQFVSTNSMSYKLNDSLRAVGSFDYLISKDRVTGQTIQKDVELEIGFAYRPVKHNRLNWLGKYIYIENTDRTGRSIDRTYEKKHILMTEAAYKIDNKWTVGSKLGYRKNSYQYQTKTNSYVDVQDEVLFFGIRAEYQIVKEWDLLLEYRGLEDLSSSDSKQGVVVGIYRSFGNHFKVGVGYNFSQIDDDLRNDKLVTKGWYLNFTGKI